MLSRHDPARRGGHFRDARYQRGQLAGGRVWRPGHHVGLALMASFADRLGLGDCLSGAVPWRGERAFGHDRGKVLVHAGLMLAGGGESCADIETLAAGGDRPLLSSVCSDSTFWRTLNQDLTPPVVDAVWAAMASVRAKVWARAAVTAGSDPVVLDIDASLVEIHSENKEGSAPHFKRGFGFHPMFCFADATGEALAAILRPGNAAANNIADHEAVLDAAIAQLPPEIAAGHRPGDDPALVNRAIRVRTDSAGCTRFVHSCRARNVGFSVVARTTAAIHAALLALHVDDDAWTPLIDETTGEARDDAFVADITGLVDLSDWPDGTHLVVRRERRHPGAQHSLFPSELWPTGATTPTSPATPPCSTPTSAPTHTSNNTSPASKTPGCAACRSARWTPTPPGSPSSVGPPTSSAGSNSCACPAGSPAPPPRRCAGGSSTPPPAPSAPADNSSSGSSTTGPTPPHSSPLTRPSTAWPEPAQPQQAMRTHDLARPDTDPPTRKTPPERSTERSIAPTTTGEPDRIAHRPPPTIS